MTEEVDLVEKAAEIFLDGHTGKGNEITSQELSDRLGGVDHLDSTPNTRQNVIIPVMERYGLPIVGSPKGYYVAQSVDEYESAQDRLSARIAGIENRKELLRKCWEGEGE